MKKKLRFNKKEAVRLHRELWRWLAENSDRTKSEWPGWKNFPRVKNHCFLCEYAQEKQAQAKEKSTRLRHMFLCFWCPADWGVDRCEDPHSCFANWKLVQLVSKEQAAYAKQVAEIKIRKLKGC